MLPLLLKSTACDVTPTILSRKSVVNPFMTLMTTISEATPRATPATEIQEMTEMNAWSLRADKYRRAIKNTNRMAPRRHTDFFDYTGLSHNTTLDGGHFHFSKRDLCLSKDIE
jgi:hypothetical protein